MVFERLERIWECELNLEGLFGFGLIPENSLGTLKLSDLWMEITELMILELEQMQVIEI